MAEPQKADGESVRPITEGTVRVVVTGVTRQVWDAFVGNIIAILEQKDVTSSSLVELQWREKIEIPGFR